MSDNTRPDNTRSDKKSPRDTQSAFGHYRPKSAVQQLLTLSQHAPDNFISRQLAKLIRGWVKKRTRPPMDVEVAGLKLRCYLWDNYTERKLVFMPWRFDVRERRMMLSVLPADGVFIDIGANNVQTAADHC